MVERMVERMVAMPLGRAVVKPPAIVRLVRVVASLVIVLSGASCSLTDSGSEPNPTPAVIATGQHCVGDDPARGCRAATIVLSESELPEALRLWGYPADEVQYADKALVIVGFDESSNCPAQVDDVVLENGVLSVMISTPGPDGCTSDAASRSFIIQITSGGTIDAVTINSTDVELLSP